MGDQHIDDAVAERAVFAEPAKVKIGTYEVLIRPLNLKGLKENLGIAQTVLRSLRDGYAKYQNDLEEWRKRKLAGEDVEPPDTTWFMPVLIDNVDIVTQALLVILRRDKPEMTMEYLEENLEPFIHLPDIIEKLRDVNMLGELAKKVKAAGLFDGVKLQMPRPKFDSPTLRSTSPSTTESQSTTSPDLTADTSSPS